MSFVALILEFTVIIHKIRTYDFLYFVWYKISALNHLFLKIIYGFLWTDTCKSQFLTKIKAQFQCLEKTSFLSLHKYLKNRPTEMCYNTNLALTRMTSAIKKARNGSPCWKYTSHMFCITGKVQVEANKLLNWKINMYI